MTIEELPDLKKRLEAQGWNVKQVGNELVCEPVGLVRRVHILSDPLLRKFIEEFDAEVESVIDLRNQR